MKMIEIIVTTKGETSVQTKGFAGSSCRDASRFIEQALGQRIGEHLPSSFTNPKEWNGLAGSERRMYRKVATLGAECDASLLQVSKSSRSFAQLFAIVR